MDNSVIIVLSCSGLVGWIAWLIYGYAVFNKQITIKSEVSYWKNRVTRVQDCIIDLVNVIHKQFPNSTIKYRHDDKVDCIEGEIKY